MEAKLEPEKQRSMTEEAQKTQQIEAQPIRLEVEALENEAHGPDSLQQRLKDFEDEESVFVSPKQEIAKEVKPVHVPENSMTLDGAHMLTSTPKQRIKPQQLKVKFQDEEVASNEGFHAETPANTVIL